MVFTFNIISRDNSLPSVLHVQCGTQHHTELHSDDGSHFESSDALMSSLPNML